MDPARPVLSRTMDVLYKTDPTPRPLRGQCVDVVAGMTLKSLWVEFAAQLENSGGKTAAFLMRATEAELRSWSMFLTLDLRLQILEATSKLVMSNLGGGNNAGPIIGGRQIFTPPNPAAALLASLLEIFFDPSFRKLTLYNDLHWNKDSRIQVLHLLHQKTSLVKELNLACYRSPQYRIQAMPFSEKFILSGCFGRFPELRILTMPNIADDDLLDKIGESCPRLEELDVSGSFGVTNQGIERFCRHSTGGVALQSQKGLFSFKKQIDVSKRVGYLATPMAGCCAKRQFSERKFGAKKPADPTDDDDNGSTGKSALKRVDLTGTAIDFKGLECLLRDCKMLVTISVDDEIWTALLSTLTDDGPGCLDCVGPAEHVSAISMTSNVDKYLDVIVDLFPNLRHVTIDGAGTSQNFPTFLPMLDKQTSLTVKDVNLDRICPSIRASGSRIRRLNFSGKTSVLDLVLLDEACPNLESLWVAHSQVVVGSTTGHFPERSGPRRFRHLKQCKLWDLNAASEDWKTLVRWAEHLQALYIWNVVITDADMADILARNRLQDLEDFRVGSTEIGFVRLSETTAVSLVRSCPNLKNLGGLCDWKIRDLLTLLQTLLIQGGWKITLEPQQVSTIM